MKGPLELFDNLDDAVVVADGEGRVLFCNRAAAGLFDIRRARLEGTPLAEADGLASTPLASGEVREEARSSGTWTGTSSHTRPGRPPLELHWTVKPLDAQHTDELTTIGIARVTLEASDLERPFGQLAADANAALRTSETQFRNLVEASPMGVHMYELTGDDRLVFTGANAAADRILGVDNSLFLGKTLEEAFPPLADTEIPNRYRIAARDGLGWQTEQVDYEHESIRGAFEVYAFQTAPMRMAAMFVDITERKRIDDELRASAQRLALHVRNTPLGVIEWTVDRVAVAWNTAAERIFGYSREEAIGKRTEEFLVPEHARADVARLWADLVALRGGTRSTNENLDKAGETLICEWYNTPLVDSENRVFGVASLVQDVTAQRRAEAALRASEERYRLLAENATDVIWSMDLAGRLTYVSPSVERISGYTPEEMLNMSIEDYSDAASAERMRALIRTELEKPKGERLPSITVELRQRSKDGRLFDAEVSATWVVAEDDTPVGFQGITRDISARVRAEEEQRKLSALIESSNEFIGIAGVDGKVLYLNSAGRRMVGLASLDEARSKLITDFVSSDFVPELTAEIVPAALREGSVRGENQFRHFVTGEPIDVAYELFVIRPDDASSSTNLAIVATDITARKVAETERLALEQQLRQSQKLEAIGRLAGGVAHDFNNILTGIIGYADLLLLDLAKEDPSHADIAEIRKAADRAAELTNQLLAFSRRQVTVPKVVDPNEIVERSKRMLERIIGEDIRLIFVAGAPLSSIRIDPAQIDQILVNLAVNARDAMPNGGQLTIETGNLPASEAPVGDSETAPGKDLVRISIRDTGCGIDAAARPHIFEPFFSTKAKDQGTGLGLATVYGIVKQNDGIIEVHSELGVGTSFEIYFPAIMEEAEKLDERAPADRPLGTETILLVEDEPTCRELAQKILKRHGYRVVALGSAGDALNAAHGHRGHIDLLLTDVVMPGMNGRELYDELRESRPELRVLFMSGYAANHIAKHGVLDPDTAFVQKPFTVESLTRAVRQILDTGA